MWNDDGKLALTSPDGKQRRVVSRKGMVYLRMVEGRQLRYGIGKAENRHR